MGESLTELSEFQKRIHTVDIKNPNDMALSAVFPSCAKVEYSTPITEGMPVTEVSINTSVLHQFAVTPNADRSALATMVIEFDLPDIEIIPEMQEKYRIAWTPSIFHAMVKSAKMIIKDDAGETVVQYRDSHILNTILQLDMIGDRTIYEQSIGNIPTLISTDLVRLPAITLAPEQLWSFSKYMGTYPFLLLYHRHHRVYFEYEFERDISRLIRMYEFVDNEWKLVTTKPLYLRINGNKVEGKDLETQFMKLKVPRGIVKYRSLTSTSKEFYLTSVFDSPNTSGNNDMCVYYDDYHPLVIQKPNWNPNKVGSETKTIPLKALEKGDTSFILESSPVKALYWMLENRNSTARNLYGNYSTNPTDITLGSNPVVAHEINYRGIKVLSVTTPTLKTLTSDFRSKPRVEGYNAYSATGTNNPDRLEPGWVFDPSDTLVISSTNTTRIGKQRDEVPSRSNIESSRVVEDNAPYRVHVIKRIARCIRYSRVKKPDSNAETVVFTIE